MSDLTLRARSGHGYRSVGGAVWGLMHCVLSLTNGEELVDVAISKDNSGAYHWKATRVQSIGTHLMVEHPDEQKARDRSAERCIAALDAFLKTEQGCA